MTKTVSPSQMAFSSDNLQMGKSLKITILSGDPGCIHKLTYQFGSASGDLAVNIKDSFQWEIPDLSYACGTSGICTITCTTSLGARVLGKTEKSLVLRVPDPSRAQLSQAVLGMGAHVKCQRFSPYFTLEVSLILGENEYPVGKGQEDFFSWTPEYDLATGFPDRVYLDGKLCCRTFNREHLVGTKYSLISLKVPKNDATRPKIQSVILKPVSPSLPEEYGYLRGKTGVRAEIQAVSAYSQIDSYVLTVGTRSVSGNPAVLPVLSEAGTLAVRVAVRDRRGFEGIFQTEIFSGAYEKPQILPLTGDQVVCRRADAEGRFSDQGKNLRIMAKLRITEIAPGGENKNHGSLSYRIRGGSGAFSPWCLLTLSPEGAADQNLNNLVPSLKTTYQVELKAEDSLQETTVLSFTVLTAQVSFGLYDGVDGAAFGKYPELPHVVDLAPQMTLLVRGRLELPGETWQDLGLGSNVPEAGAFVGPVRGAAFRLRPGNQGVLAFSCGLPAQGAAVNREPVPAAPQMPVTALCASEGGGALMTLGTDGFLRAGTLLGKQDPSWIQGLITYFI